MEEPSLVEHADAQLRALADELARRHPLAGDVLDGPPAAPPALPGRPAPGVAGAPVAIPGLQLTA